jgi:hypothetical protein
MPKVESKHGRREDGLDVEGTKESLEAALVSQTFKLHSLQCR